MKLPCSLCCVLFILTSLPAAPALAQIDPGSWTLVVLPDTQRYVQYPEDLHHFQAQTQWIADNADDLNIKFAIHVGDIVQHNTAAQWDMAKAAMDTINGVVPYSLSVGNHDMGTNGSSDSRNTLFNHNDYFGPTS